MNMDRRELLKFTGLIVGVAVSPSCRQALESGTDLSAAPVGGALSEDQQKVIAVLTDLIIPPTDTPGAVDAGVPAFIQQIVVDWYTPAERQIFLEGLAELDAAAKRHWSALFMDLTTEQQTQLLTELEPPMEGISESRPGSVAAMPPGASGDVPFFLKLKELTVLGYYTSEVGVTAELLYRPVPGAYDGDAVFTGRQWVQ